MITTDRSWDGPEISWLRDDETASRPPMRWKPTALRLSRCCATKQSECACVRDAAYLQNDIHLKIWCSGLSKGSPMVYKGHVMMGNALSSR
jgi:hypothetical protein